MEIFMEILRWLMVRGQRDTQREILDIVGLWDITKLWRIIPSNTKYGLTNEDPECFVDYK